MALLTGGEALAQQLQRESITEIFGVPGVQLDWGIDGIQKLNGAIKFVTMRHEQAASYAADGYARSGNKPGVCMVVPGPGLFNAMAGLSTAYACNSPVLCIVGQINSKAIGKGWGLLHELPDQSAALDNVSKWHAMAKRPEEIPGLVREAIHQLNTGRPMPVVLEMPQDVLAAKGEMELCEPHAPSARTSAPNANAVRDAAEMLRGAKHITIYAGGGVHAARASEELRQLAEKLDAPVVMSGNGRGALPDAHPLALPHTGARALFPASDVVVVVASRLIDGSGNLGIKDATNAKYIYLNIDPREVTPPRKPDVFLQADAKQSLRALLAALGDGSAARDGAARAAKVRAWCDEQIAQIEPQLSLVRALRNAIPQDGILVSEMTQVGYLARVAYPTFAPRTFITPGYQGTLGYGYPTALGVAVANPGRPVVSINGDGGFGFALQELATAKKYNIPVVGVVFNDSAYGNVKRMHLTQFGFSNTADLANPDFVKLAEAFGLAGQRVTSPDELEQAIKDGIAARQPCLIEMPVSTMPESFYLISETMKRTFPELPRPQL